MGEARTDEGFCHVQARRGPSWLSASKTCCLSRRWSWQQMRRSRFAGGGGNKTAGEEFQVGRINMSSAYLCRGDEYRNGHVRRHGAGYSLSRRRRWVCAAAGAVPTAPPLLGSLRLSLGISRHVERDMGETHRGHVPITQRWCGGFEALASRQRPFYAGGFLERCPDRQSGG